MKGGLTYGVTGKSMGVVRDGIDLAKRVIQVNGFARDGSVLIRRPVARERILFWKSL